MSTTLEGIACTTSLYVEAWEDPLIDRLGYDPRSSYVERFWLPVLGPSTTWLLRHLATRLEDRPQGALIDIATTARSLGLGERTGRNAPFFRTLTRAIDFGMARVSGPDRLKVRRNLPPLARRHLLRLPDQLRDEHARHVAVGGEGESVERLREHGRDLAARLLALGESDESIEAQLRRWHFPEEMILECLQRARGAGDEHAGKARASSVG